MDFNQSATPRTPEAPVSEVQQATSQVGKYEQQFSKFRIIPQHEFEHRTMVLETSKVPEKAIIEDILTKELELANIKDDKLVRIYQIQLQNVLEWYDMGLWEQVGRWAFTRMIGELQLSKSKGSGERMLQAGAIPVVSGIVGGIAGLLGRKPQFQHEYQQQSQDTGARGMIERGSQYG